MLGSCGPVLHFPQVLLLELFEGDEVELTFLMGKLSQTYRAEQWTLFAVRVEANNFDLLVFVLFVHAVELGLDAKFSSVLLD